MLIRLLISKNPKRPGSKSYDRFSLYRDGMTIREALDAGILSADFNWDTERSFIAIVEPTKFETIAVIETNLDDTTGEIVGALAETLMSAGALDVFVTPVLGKKGRPAQVVSALAAPAQAERIAELMLAHSTTFGVRWREEKRIALERAWREVATPWGAVRVKIGKRGGEILQRSPEFEDCRACAEKMGVPVRRVYEAALAAAQELKDG